MSIVIEYSSNDDKIKVIGILDKEHIEYKIIDPIESIKSSELKKSIYNNENEYDADNPSNFYDLLYKITKDKKYDIVRINEVYYGNKNKDGIYYNKIYSSNPLEQDRIHQLSYTDYLNKLNGLIETVTKYNYKDYHPEEKMFEGTNPDGILYKNLYDNNKRHFDDFDEYMIYKSQLDLGKEHDEAVNITKNIKIEEKEKQEKERKEKERKEKEKNEIINSKEEYEENVPLNMDSEFYNENKDKKNKDGIQYNLLYGYLGQNKYIREHDYEQYIENRENLKKMRAGKRKTRRNRKSKKGKRSRKARKSRRKSNRRRGRR